MYSGTSADTPPVVNHVRRDSQNAAIKERLRNEDDELEIVIVKDMMLTGYDFKAALNAGGPRAFVKAAHATVNYLRDAATAGNQVAEEEETLAVRFRKLSSQLARAWAICGGSETLAHLHPEVRFYEEVRVWMAKFDADDRQSRGEPIPEEIQRLLGQLIAESTVSGEVLDIYGAAGMPKPTLSDLTPDFDPGGQISRHAA